MNSYSRDESVQKLAVLIRFLLAAYANFFRDRAATGIALGRALQAAIELIDRGIWDKWLAATFGLPRPAADQFIGMATLANQLANNADRGYLQSEQNNALVLADNIIRARNGAETWLLFFDKDDFVALNTACGGDDDTTAAAVEAAVAQLRRCLADVSHAAANSLKPCIKKDKRGWTPDRIARALLARVVYS